MDIKVRRLIHIFKKYVKTLSFPVNPGRLLTRPEGFTFFIFFIDK